MASATASTHQVIDLLSDDDEATTISNCKKRPHNANEDETRRVQAKPIQTNGTNDLSEVLVLGSDAPSSHDDIEIVNGVTEKLVHAPYNKNFDNDDDDICIVGSTGPNALEDFPHSRESCVKHSFSENPLLFCAQCYCFVCDQEASKCPCWNQHCHATYNQQSWRLMRQEWKLKKSDGSSVPATTAPVRPPPASTSNQAYLQRINVLTSYIQGQNEAFRQHGSFTATRQRNTSSRTARRRQRRPALRTGSQPPTAAQRVSVLPSPPPVYQTTHTVSQDRCVKDLLDGVAKHSSVQACNLVQPPPAQVFATLLRHDQLESLTFMQNMEKEVTNPSIVTGGWLSDEGDKIATTLALVATNPMLDAPSADQVCRFCKIDNKTPRLKVKCTVILTFDKSKWKGACLKHAPGLHVISDPDATHTALGQLPFADVIIVSTDSKWHDDIINNFEFHRVIADESHSSTNWHYQTARCIASQRRWCLSSTPCSTSVFDLLSQITIISPTGRWKYDGELHMALGGFRRGTAEGFHSLVQVLAKCMVRHSKSQQRPTKRQDWQSFTLPRSITVTTYLNMSLAEQLAFGYGARSLERLNGFVENGGTMNEVRLALLVETNESTLVTSKISALLSELQAARLAEPPLKVVVYTQYTAIRDACVANLERLGYDLYHVNDSMDGREDALQKFQCDRRENPAVLILQLNGSNLRFKPPAAKRVYLMEPFLDPAVEAKVTEQEGTLVARRFVYRYSAESNIVELHKQIEAGQVSLEKSGSFLPPAAIQILTKGMPQCNTKNDASETRLLNV